MTTPFTTVSDAPDAYLVAQSLKGDRDAYRTIVRRYQSIVCALTYAACGDRHRSEDLAQETFLAAWKDLGQLHDPNRLRAWLRGIARNVVNNAQRKLARTPTELATPEGDVLASDEPSPGDQAITREEQALLWENLSRLPEQYREPMVLYYREGESAAAVAAALEISEETARQRLSRGRAMLAARIEKLIDRGLRQSAPAEGFAVGVVAALPGITVSKASATLGVGAKVASVQAAGSVIPPIIGLIAMYLGYKIGLQQAIAPREREFMRRFHRIILFWALGFTIALLAVIFGTRWLGLGEGVMSKGIFALSVVYVLGIMTGSIWYARRIIRLRAELVATNADMRQKAEASAKAWAIQYRSRWTLLGLPLIDINIGQTPDARQAVARGWIAIGGIAYGPFFALGGIAVAPISWGGISLGVLTYGGCAVGVWVVGVAAVGWKAIGICAAGWHGAEGIVAVAYRYADGITAIAFHHANDPRARAVLGHETFFRAWHAIAGGSASWIWLMILPAFYPVYHRAWKLRNAAPAS